MQIAQKVTPFLSFNDQAEEAANLYVSVLPESEIVRIVRNPETGKVLTVEFHLACVKFVALNVGQTWDFTDAFSLQVNCESQEEIDDVWGRLSAGGSETRCGWLKDKFGVSWQVVPAFLSKLISDPDPSRSQRVLHALWSMVKPDVAALQAAYEGE